MARCNSSTLLTNLGLRYGPGRQGPLRGLVPPSCVHSGSRPYRSMENLNWSPMIDPNLSNHYYRSVDSEFILRYTSTSHWYDGPPDGTLSTPHPLNPETLALYPRHCIPRKDVSLLPHFLLPGGVDEWDARKGLRDKLRLQSARAAGEPTKALPLRPQVTPNVEQYGSTNGKPTRITSHEEIKQEVLRRLKLRRQNSSPNLALTSSPCSANMVKTSFTTDNIAGNKSNLVSENRRPPLGRLHIPTFEEFKKMRQKEATAGSAANDTANNVASQDNGDLHGQNKTDQQANSDSNIEKQCSQDLATFVGNGTTQFSPIRTVPSPRGPLQVLASSPQDSTSVLETGGSIKPRRSSLDTVGSVPFPPNRENIERPSSCCPALLLEGTELSKYGEKIYKMKDGLIGSALHLIKKSCSAEIYSETAVPLSPNHHSQTNNQNSLTTTATAAPVSKEEAAERARNPDAEEEEERERCCDRGNASQPPVAMETTLAKRTARGDESGNETPATTLQGERREGERKEEASEEATACLFPVSDGVRRRSSSDAGLQDRALCNSLWPRGECRLRAHFSDPMPSDPSRRKQLQMKIAAASRLHRKERDSAPAALRGRSEPPGEERQVGLGASRSAHHRWSTISSLSSDSGVVGLSDDRDEEDSAPRRSRRGKGAEVERTDSGIGPGLSRSWKRPIVSLKPCPDCGVSDGAVKDRGERMCERCSKLRTERKEAILEFLNTESSYGEDLRIIKEEFYCPMQSAGLLTAEQLTVVFANVQELIDVNERFTEHLQECIDQAFDQGDEDLLTVHIGEIFLEFVNMLPAFQTYCLQQSTSVNMLNTLEKEKELLRIFLDVSQNDNTALRRMNLRSFLMAPLQRVTKYPLLLSRIMKVTSECHPDFPKLCDAKSRVESHLEHINMKTKQEGNGVSWSLRSFRRDSRKNREVINIEMREVSMKTVGWAREHTRFVMEGPLQLSQPADGQWVKKGSKALKFQNVQTLLMVRTNRDSIGNGETGSQMDMGGESVKDGVLVLIKDKSSGKFTVLREPIQLGNCVVSTDPDCEDTFEILDIKREAFVFRASDKSRTQQWFHQIKRYARDLGSWRKRRNALPNIMISTGQTRS
ncbi:uncharacterized protein si:dkey-91i10.2 [Periophthalmus magnuspinnatus]|uniref:uncharacterized protein si:dkey-91i10.2 n=1 Tax=Periophthalmus magnuspinnatus TaxID=409849 RepID=UPI0024368F9A|nr:uncharacterized protein si:dkey-91i10.2 [Periophthalmus magnuspinnatus]